MSVPTAEQQTTINFFRKDAEVSIWTSDKTQITEFDKKYKPAKEHKDENGNVYAVEYVVDKKLLFFRSKLRKKVVLTDEQKKERAERLKRDN